MVRLHCTIANLKGMSEIIELQHMRDQQRAKKDKGKVGTYHLFLW